jgi:hypothetical protein
MNKEENNQWKNVLFNNIILFINLFKNEKSKLKLYYILLNI